MKTHTLESAAEFMGCSKDALMDLANIGAVPAAKIAGRSWVFIEDDLVAYLKEQVRQQTEERRNAFLAGRTVKIETAWSGAKKRRKPYPVLPPLPDEAAKARE